MRAGRTTFHVDEKRLEADLRRYGVHKGLIGGHPAIRLERGGFAPVPHEAPFVRAVEMDAERWERWQSFYQGGPLEIEIGAGDGRFLVARAAAHPDRRFLAIEVVWKYCQRILRRIEQEGHSNIWACDEDARYTIAHIVPNDTVSVFHVLMPDPWWKPRHQIKRVFTAPTVRMLHDKLAPGGILHVKTDVPGYAAYIRRLLGAHPGFTPHEPELAGLFRASVPTAREEWCMKVGRPVHSIYVRKRKEIL